MRLRWMETSEAHSIPLLEVKFVLQNQKITKRLEVLHLSRCFTHTPRFREAILCNECTDCRKALLCSLRQDISMKSKCKERNAFELAGLLSLGCRFSSHVAANHRYLISLPCPVPAGLGCVTSVPNGLQGGPNLPP